MVAGVPQTIVLQQQRVLAPAQQRQGFCATCAARSFSRW
jgi:hypothetical protein